MNTIKDALTRVAAGTSTIDDSLVLGDALERQAAEIGRLRVAEERQAAVMTDSRVTDQSGQVPVLEWLGRTNPHIRAATALTDAHVDSALAVANAGRPRRVWRGRAGLVGAR